MTVDPKVVPKVGPLERTTVARMAAQRGDGKVVAKVALTVGRTAGVTVGM